MNTAIMPKSYKASINILVIMSALSTLFGVIAYNQLIVYPAENPAVVETPTEPTETPAEAPTQPQLTNPESTLSIFKLGDQAVIIGMQGWDSKPSAVEVFLRYNPQVVSIDQLTPNLSFLESVFQNEIDAEAGIIKYTATDLDKIDYLQNSTILFSLKYHRLDVQPGTLSVETIDQLFKTRYIDVNLTEHDFAQTNSINF